MHWGSAHDREQAFIPIIQESGFDVSRGYLIIYRHLLDTYCQDSRTYSIRCLPLVLKGHVGITCYAVLFGTRVIDNIMLVDRVIHDSAYPTMTKPESTGKDTILCHSTRGAFTQIGRQVR